VVFCDWPLSLNIRFSRLFYGRARASASFFLMDEYQMLFICSTICRHFTSVHHCGIVKTLLWTFMYKFLCEHVFVSLETMCRSIIAGSKIVLFSFSEELPVCHSATPFYITTRSVQGFYFLYILLNTCYLSY
jgi:hypothetical protein